MNKELKERVLKKGFEQYKKSTKRLNHDLFKNPEGFALLDALISTRRELGYNTSWKDAKEFIIELGIEDDKFYISDWVFVITHFNKFHFSSCPLRMMSNE